MKKVFFVFLSCTGVFLFLHFSIAELEPSPIVITEIGAFESTQHEWVEIYNAGEDFIDITNWIFWEGGVNHQLTLARGENFLLPGTFAVIAQSADNFLQDYPTVTSTLFDSSWGSLNESGEEIGLKDAAGEFIEQFTYLPARDFSLERHDPTSFDYSENNWSEHVSGNTAGTWNSVWAQEAPAEEEQQEIVEESGHDSAGTQNSEEIHEIVGGEPSEGIIKEDADQSGDEDVEEPEESLILADDFFQIYTAPATEQAADRNITEESQDIHVRINEFLAYPGEDKEWIELLNNSTSTAHMVAWSLWDGVGQIAVVSSTIEGHGFLLIELPSAKLNNSGDTLILKDALGNIIDQVVYGDWGNEPLGNIAAPKRGVAVARVDSEFFHTTTLTLGTANIIVEPVVTESTNSRRDASIKTEIQAKSSAARYPASTVVINELASVPAQGEEWVELYNNTNDWLELGGWSIEDGAGTRTNVSGALPPHGFFVIDQPRGKLNNSGDKVTLRDPSGAAIDEVMYGSWENNGKENPSAPGHGHSLARLVDGKDTNDNKKDFVVTRTTTKGGLNVIDIIEAIPPISPLSQPAKNTSSTLESPKIEVAPKEIEPRNISGLFISEIFPNPFGRDAGEFIELGNNGTAAVHLSGLWLDDVEGGSRPFQIPDGMEIAPGAFVVFEKVQTRLTFNNTSDSVRVLFGEEILLEVGYDDPEEGASYIQDPSGGWIWTAEVTPGAENAVEATEEGEEGEVEEAKSKGKKSVLAITAAVGQIQDLDIGTRVIVNGVVVVEPGIFGSQYFYLVDAVSSSESGVQIYIYTKDFPPLQVGDTVQVIGEISQSAGQKRVKIKRQEDIRMIGHEPALTPELFEIGTIGDETIGNLISVQGEIMKKKNKYIYVDDGTGEVQVYLKAGVPIDFSALTIGQHVQVTGIIIKTKNGYQLLPRGEHDIENVETPMATDGLLLTQATTSGHVATADRPYVAASIGGGISVLLGILGKLRGAAAWRWARRGVVALGFFKKNRG